MYNVMTKILVTVVTYRYFFRLFGFLDQVDSVVCQQLQTSPNGTESVVCYNEVFECGRKRT